jgi:hypothetical protein
MAKRIRKQVYVDSRQVRLLKERARRAGVTESEFIRRAIDQALASEVIGTTNPAAWKQFQRQVARFLKRTGSATIKPWTRDEL